MDGRWVFGLGGDWGGGMGKAGLSVFGLGLFMIVLSDNTKEK
jgi:hypothetical protein